MVADTQVLSGGQVNRQAVFGVEPRPLDGSIVGPHPHPQASRTEQDLQRELDTLRGQCQTQALAGAELRARLESLQAEVSIS